MTKCKSPIVLSALDNVTITLSKQFSCHFVRKMFKDFRNTIKQVTMVCIFIHLISFLSWSIPLDGRRKDFSNKGQTQQRCEHCPSLFVTRQNP